MGFEALVSDFLCFFIRVLVMTAPLLRRYVELVTNLIDPMPTEENSLSYPSLIRLLISPHYHHGKTTTKMFPTNLSYII